MTAPTVTREPVADDFDLSPYRCTELARFDAVDQDGDPVPFALVIEEAGPTRTVSVCVRGAFLQPTAQLLKDLTAMFDLAATHQT